MGNTSLKFSVSLDDKSLIKGTVIASHKTKNGDKYTLRTDIGPRSASVEASHTSGNVTGGVGYRMNLINPFASNDIYHFNTENIGEHIVKRQEVGVTINTGVVEVVVVAVAAAVYFGVPAAIASGVATAVKAIVGIAATFAEMIAPYIPYALGTGTFFITLFGLSKENECDG